MIGGTMKYIRLIFAIGIFFLLITPVHAAVVLNEIYPKTSDPNYNWIELYNTGNESVSLNQWKIDHFQGDGKASVLNASMIIGPHAFLTLYGTQMGITFGTDGDTIRLLTNTNQVVDSVSYPSILGYNTSYGRNPDGTGSWVICVPVPPYGPTPNTNNNCPEAPSPTTAPTPTPTPLPKLETTVIPHSFAQIVSTPTPTPEVLGVVVTNTPIPLFTVTPTKTENSTFQFTFPKTWIGYAMLLVAIAALSILVTLWLSRRHHK